MLGRLKKEKLQFAQIPGFSAAFDKETRELGASRVKIITAIGAVCYPAFGVMDWILYPHLIDRSLPVRVIFTLIACLSLAFSKRNWWKNNAAMILFFTALFADFGISYLNSQISGWTSFYFVGNILVTTGITMFVPWSPRVTLIYVSSTLLGYIVLNRLFHPFSLDMLAPVMFLATIGIQSFLSTILDEFNRMKDLSSRFAIEKAHGELKAQSDLLQKQIEAAKDIQQALLPPLVQDIAGFRIEAIYEPSAHLSGDFFDARVCGEWVYIYLADVTGHGLPAAQITFLVKEIFKTALNHEIELSELFDVVRKNYADHQLGYDLGLQLARIHTKSLKAEYLKSNSPNPVIVRATGDTEEIELSPSPIISASVDVSLRQPAKVTVTSMDAATKVYLYSDGAYEFFTESGREFGQRKLLKEFGKTQSEAWPEGLRGRLVAENRDDLFPDDLTVLRIYVIDKIG